MPVDDSRPFRPINIAVLTISDTRGPEDDRSGDLLAARITEAGHRVADRRIARDEVGDIVELMAGWIEHPEIDCIVSSGGTGVTGRDVTPEAVEALCDKIIPGFGELFRWISFQSIGTSAIQSRAIAGVARGTYIFALPGSPGAVRDGWDQILKLQLDNRHQPCNFVELMPRLAER